MRALKKQIAMCGRSIGQETDQPPVDSQNEMEALNSTFKKLNIATNHMSLEVDPSPVKPSGENLTVADTMIVKFLRAQ